MRQYARDGRPLPEAIANAPVLLEGLELYYRAFHDLDSCRARGWDEGPIPLTAIYLYAEANGFEGEERRDLVELVTELDRAYLGWRRKQREADGDG